jgi:prophage maintenance system killer protein
LPNPRRSSGASIGHAATQTFLILNRTEIAAAVDAQGHLILDLAADRIGRSHSVD